jgi:hypothetical protein
VLSFGPRRRATWLLPDGQQRFQKAHCASVRSARPATSTLADNDSHGAILAADAIGQVAFSYFGLI